MDDLFIVEIENALTSELCNEIIERFERDENKRRGEVGNGVLVDIKKSTDLFISTLPDWYDINQSLLKNLHQSYKNVYCEKIKKITDANRWWYTSYKKIHNLDDKKTTKTYAIPGVDDIINTISGFQIQRTKKGESYDWHTDYRHSEYRYLTYIYYLNTLDEEDGGCTEFINGKKVKPEQGKLLIFPATWTCVHRGTPVLGKTKYITTGFLKYVEPSVDLPHLKL
jgi:hypothetical protein